MEMEDYDELDDDITTQTETHQQKVRPTAAVDEGSNNDYQEDDYQDDDYQEEERDTYYTYYDDKGNFVRTYSNS